MKRGDLMRLRSLLSLPSFSSERVQRVSRSERPHTFTLPSSCMPSRCSIRSS